MTWDTRRISLLEWQGKLWIPLNELPHFSQPDDNHQRPVRPGFLPRWMR
ncbi:hypothetical protein [Pseudomonas cavernicola]|nr:hypothetical protein [Pseudomonas cavernicola]